VAGHERERSGQARGVSRTHGARESRLS
jgi:hypothetical protein